MNLNDNFLCLLLKLKMTPTLRQFNNASVKLSFCDRYGALSLLSMVLMYIFCFQSGTIKPMYDFSTLFKYIISLSFPYQWRKALRLNMAVNCSEMRLNSSWMAVEFPTNVPDILSPRGGMSHTATFTLLGIHSTK